MLPSWLFITWGTAVGLVVGSFLNVVAHRLPRGLSVVWPGSHCPWCGGAVRALDNLPVLSFLLLRGRCRRCGAPISWRYPLLEGLTAVIFAALAWRHGYPPNFGTFAAFAVLATFLLALAAIDLEHFLLPDALTFGGIAAGLALQAWIPQVSWVDAAVGVLAGAGGLFLLAEAWLWLRGEEGLGLGDAKMAALIGAFLGWQGTVVAVVGASIIGAVVGLTLLAARRMHSRSPLPFGVFLALGALLAIFFPIAFDPFDTFQSSLGTLLEP